MQYRPVLPAVIQSAVAMAAVFFPAGVTADGARLVTREMACFVLDGHLEAWSGWHRLPARAPAPVREAAAAPAQPGRQRRGRRARCWTACSWRGTCPAARRPVTTPTPAPSSWPPACRWWTSPTHAWTSSRRSTARRTAACPWPPPDPTTPPSGSPAPAAPSASSTSATTSARTTSPASSLPPRSSTLTRVPRWQCRSPNWRTLPPPWTHAAPGNGYRAAAVRRFRHQARRSGGAPAEALDLTAGTLNELIAYTGFGKSVVLVETFACWAARNGIVVTFAVPTNADVIRYAHQIERSLALLGSDVAVTPLMSPRSVLTVAETTANRTTPHGPGTDWTWSRLGYGCALTAAATTDAQVDAWQPGQEPCATLRPSDTRPEQARPRRRLPLAHVLRQVQPRTGSVHGGHHRHLARQPAHRPAAGPRGRRPRRHRPGHRRGARAPPQPRAGHRRDRHLPADRHRPGRAGPAARPGRPHRHPAAPPRHRVRRRVRPRSRGSRRQRPGRLLLHPVPVGELRQPPGLRPAGCRRT